MSENSQEIKISVIVPVYNVEQYLDECVESVLGQTYRNIELILVDDGATDSSGGMCDSWADKDDRVKVIHKQNGGLSSARNAGLDEASGDYIAFIDSDDYWDDMRFLEESVDVLKEKHLDILIFGLKKVNEQGVISIEKLTPTDSLTDAIKSGSMRICAWNQLVRHQLVTCEGIRFREGVISEDMEWTARIYQAAGSTQVVSQTPYCYRQRGGSITHTSTGKHAEDVFNNYKICIDLMERMSEEKKQAYCYFLARAFSMLVINVAGLDAASRKQYYAFIREHKWVLAYNTRMREKIFLMMLKLVGVNCTCRLLNLARKFV